MIRRMDQKLDGLCGDMIEGKERLGFLDGSFASLSRRAGRLGGAVAQIRRRLDLVDAPG